MKMHRNSQKRIYVKDAVYFITVNVFDREPHFKNDDLCKLLVEEIRLCEKLKSFYTYGYKVNPDHIHLLIQPGKFFNHSEIMRSLKTNAARNINYLFGHNDLLLNPELESRKAKSMDFVPSAKPYEMRPGTGTEPDSDDAVSGQAKSRDFASHQCHESHIPRESTKTLAIEQHTKLLIQHRKYLIDLKTKTSNSTTDSNTKFKWQRSFHDHIIRDKQDYYMRLNYIRKQWKKHKLPENKYCFTSGKLPSFNYTKRLYEHF